VELFRPPLSGVFTTLGLLLASPGKLADSVPEYVFPVPAEFTAITAVSMYTHYLTTPEEGLAVQVKVTAWSVEAVPSPLKLIVAG
jgi:hypothetical protein